MKYIFYFLILFVLGCSQLQDFDPNPSTTIIKTIAFDGVGSVNFVAGKYVCIRRANDMHQEGGYIPSPQVNVHLSDQYGSHHANDAAALFKTLEMDLNMF